MTRAFIHIGLVVALVLGPTHCCCQAGWLLPALRHAPTHTPFTSDLPAADEDDCLKAAKTCCAAPTHHHPSHPSESPQPAPPPECACCAERPDAALPESAATGSAPQPTGELLSLVLAGVLGGSESAGAVRDYHPPDGTGVDARYAALFERHVLRC